MKKLIIKERMAAIEVTAGTAFDGVLVGVPRDVEAVQVAFGITNDTYTVRVDAIPSPGGEWLVRTAANAFGSAYNAHYHVIGTLHGNSVRLGGGTLRVLAAVPAATEPNANTSANTNTNS